MLILLSSQSFIAVISSFEEVNISFCFLGVPSKAQVNERPRIESLGLPRILAFLISDFCFITGNYNTQQEPLNNLPRFPIIPLYCIAFLLRHMHVASDRTQLAISHPKGYQPPVPQAYPLQQPSSPSPA